MNSKVIIDNLCEARSTTKTAIAGVLGVDESTIYRRIAKNLLTMEDLSKLSAHFVISMEELLTSNAANFSREEVISIVKAHQIKINEILMLLESKND
jgi:plasmid maintenance system antidote protein VapI